MPKTITGVPTALAADETPSMVVPEAGDLAAAGVLEAALQAGLNDLGTTAKRLNELINLVLSGVPLVQNVLTIAALKAIDTSVYGAGQLCMVRGTSVLSGVLRGGGLFMFLPGTDAERTVPGVPDAHLVVAPNAGAGRWYNVAAALGWRSDFFAGQVRREVGITKASSTSGSPIVVPVSGSFVDTGLEFDVSGVEIGDSLEVDWSLTASCPVNSPIEFRFGLRLNGGALIPIEDSLWLIQGGPSFSAQGVRLRFTDDYTAGATHRVVVQVWGSSGNVTIGNKWSVVAKRYSTQLT